MSMKFNTTLPSPTELKEEYPLSDQTRILTSESKPYLSWLPDSLK